MQPALTDFQRGLQVAARIAEGYAIEGIDKEHADKLDELVGEGRKAGRKEGAGRHFAQAHCSYSAAENTMKTKRTRTIEVSQSGEHFDVAMLIPERGGSVAVASQGRFPSFGEAWTEAQRVSALWGGLHILYRKSA